MRQLNILKLSPVLIVPINAIFCYSSYKCYLFAIQVGRSYVPIYRRNKSTLAASLSCPNMIGKLENSIGRYLCDN